MGECLVSLYAAAESAAPYLPDQPEFDLKDYAFEILPKMEHRSPGMIQALAGVQQHLEGFWSETYGALPRRFCHGDFHPVNVIWGDTCIASVIDWEFCGTKVEGYDAALLLGCLGFEEPENLLGEMALAFVETLRREKRLSPLSWQTLPELVIAIRFGWLREWIWRPEPETLELELAYLDILVRNADNLRRQWQLG